ncbi:MAG: hypothetical protein GY768_09675 [Planctomycetaceae bacterium]|nr:hypothetical protein [Planctomycetaceae bacterium]
MAESVPIMFAAMGANDSNVALVTFSIYLVLVMIIAWLSSRVASSGGFISEYFLGSRNLGVWAFALTFAATSASGGTFVGFPALIYTHGWVLALWIAGYMVVPIVAMGLLGKRLNQISRRVEAVTIPEVLGDRFESPIAGIVGTLLIIIFMFYYLLAQFKAGSEILVSLFEDVPLYQVAVGWTEQVTSQVPFLSGTEPDYVLCLTVFSAAVIFYVVYGGFRAVVWTDVMQGIIMFGGVIIMLILALYFTGGLTNATRQLGECKPPVFATAEILPDEDYSSNAIPRGTWIETSAGDLIRTGKRVEVQANANKTTQILILQTDAERQRVDPNLIRHDIRVKITDREPYAYGDDVEGVYLRPPGPSPKSMHGFLALGMAFSFFAFWPFGGSGQPSNMVRLMAFRNTRTLKMSIVTVSIYFSVIYFSLVIIFCCAKVLIPGMELNADRIMPEMAVRSTEMAGFPWLAGILLAAPFAAVMSSVDSFLLVVSSSIVRDIYQRYINPNAHETQLKRVTYGGTIVIGVLATLAALYPPQYLQDIIVKASGGLAASFLVPMAFALYWRRMTASAAITGMAIGFLTHFILSLGLVDEGAGWQDLVPQLWSWFQPIALAFFALLRGMDRLQLEPFIWDLAFSAISVIVVSLITKPPRDEVIEKFFNVD